MIRFASYKIKLILYHGAFTKNEFKYNVRYTNTGQIFSNSKNKFLIILYYIKNHIA